MKGTVHPALRQLLKNSEMRNQFYSMNPEEKSEFLNWYIETCYVKPKHSSWKILKKILLYSLLSVFITFPIFVVSIAVFQLPIWVMVLLILSAHYYVFR